MKQISKKEYEKYQQYQTDKLHGRILTPDGLRVIRDLLDEKLAEASEYYAHYRQEKKLGPLELILLQPQTFALYRDVQVWNGASPNQLKPIHVITNPKTEAFFRGLKIST